MLIIEGADCLGKTTAAQKIVAMHEEARNYDAAICNETGQNPEIPLIQYKHMGRPDEETFDFFNDYTSMMDPYSVQDRFHLGGIIWHVNKITAATLKIIEGRLLSKAAFIIVFYCSDYRWYLEKLKDDKRGNLFDPDTIIEANHEYIKMARGNHKLQPYIDDVWDLKQPYGAIEYPSDEVLKGWYDRWIERLVLLDWRNDD